MGILFGHDGPVYSDKNTQTRAKWQVRAMPPFSMPIFVTCLVSIAFQGQETDDAIYNSAWNKCIPGNYREALATGWPLFHAHS